MMLFSILQCDFMCRKRSYSLHLYSLSNFYYNCFFKYKFSALHHAVQRGNINLVSALIARKANIETRDMVTSIQYQYRCRLWKYRKEERTLVSIVSFLNYFIILQNGSTPVHAATNSIEIMSLFISLGANLNVKDEVTTFNILNCL